MKTTAAIPFRAPKVPKLSLFPPVTIAVGPALTACAIEVVRRIAFGDLPYGDGAATTGFIGVVAVEFAIVTHDALKETQMNIPFFLAPWLWLGALRLKNHYQKAAAPRYGGDFSEARASLVAVSKNPFEYSGLRKRADAYLVALGLERNGGQWSETPARAIETP